MSERRTKIRDDDIDLTDDGWCSLSVGVSEDRPGLIEFCGDGYETETVYLDIAQARTLAHWILARFPEETSV